jgi:hypothetical protein
MRKWYIESMRREIYPTYNKRRKTNLIGHILRRNHFSKTHSSRKDRRRNSSDGKEGRRRTQLLDYLKEKKKD